MHISALGAHGNAVIRHGFYSDKDLDFQARGVLGRASTGASDVGEVLSTLARISKASDWAPEWSTAAKQVHAEAERAKKGGHLVTASSGFLRAATYWACAVDGLTQEEDSAELLKAFRAHRASWDAVIECSRGAFLKVDVPYESRTLPGYLLRPDATGAARPTLVVTNGSDGAISDLWSFGVAAALARDWNAFVYDGPGQQSMLFEHRTTFRPDWEAVLTPVVDFLVARPDVDARRLTGYGVSQAGYWLPRALGFEHRLVAAVVDPGVVDVSTSWTKQLSKGIRAALDKGNRASFNRDMDLALHIPGLRKTLTARGRPYRHKDWFDLYTEVLQYRLDAEIAEAIQTPLLIADPADEQFWPGQATQLAQMVHQGGGRADVMSFTADTGANYHCEPLGRLAVVDQIFDWLEPFAAEEEAP